MNNQAPSIYESFNARTLTNQQLCDSFIISEDFQELASANHTIMIGPRGSGKTTLVRMLQAESLDIWTNDLAQSYRDNVTFSGVFIPTDRFWKKQYTKIKEQTQSNPRVETLLLATFTYHTLERLTTTLEYRCKRSKQRFKPIKISKNDESELVFELAKLWKVTPRIPSIRSLETSITSKKKEIIDFISAVEQKKEKLEIEPTSIQGEISSILGDSIRIINTYINERGSKWAFLFDELELAPEEIIQPLVDSMRGGSEDVILKLSLSPYHKHLNITKESESSMRNQDLSLINLTGKSEASGLDFSRRLCESILQRHNLDKGLDHYFKSPSDIDTPRIFTELSEKDPAFEGYIKERQIEPEQIGQYSEEDKLPLVRKVKFIANIRNYYIKKSRKRCPDYYAGFENLSRAMEYNPRMLIGLMNRLIPFAKEDGEISVSRQLKALKDILNSYKALLNTIGIASDASRFTTIYDIINFIASYFKHEIRKDDFTPEPKGTITFKKEGNENFLDAIGLALNAGALISVTSASSREAFHNMEDLKNARCRLSHLFAHEYNLLFAVARPIDFSDLLSVANQKVSEISVIDIDKKTEVQQLDLL